VDAFRLSAEWNPTDTVNVRLATDFINDNSPAKHGHREVPGLGLTAGEVVLKNIYDTRGGIGDDNKVTNEGVSLTVGWDLSDALTFKSITAYREGRTDTVIDFDTSPKPALDVPGRYRDRQTTQEFQLLFDYDRPASITWMRWPPAHSTRSSGRSTSPSPLPGPSRRPAMRPSRT